MLDVATATAALQERPRDPAPEGAGCHHCSIRHLTICAPLQPEELSSVAAIADRVDLAPDELLFDAGEPARRVFTVSSGMLKTYKLLPDGRRQITGFMIVGDVLGLADEGCYAYSVEGLTQARLCSFERERLERLLEAYPKMERRLLSMASHEIATAHEQMLLLGRKTAKEKIASFLVGFRQRAAARGLSADPVHLPMSRADLGDFLGLTMETVSRTFSRLRKDGIIALHNGGRVEVRDLNALANMAEGV
ncbi:transcriptional regulator, Crp/Fnr family [Limimonas halophila]|uniref:Transcriptional regulator, Crp/Fnr family n=1 Tax=Limimonas halophila TaxID=1082479 RepID=A0A1G7TFT2_9PROT|nr:helix-turn-helix domain-containing protein [Limimonas halophila]SDG33420.1 transcriptional regulator, Crp/Fnr family [Limimonas halophila]